MVLVPVSAQAPGSAPVESWPLLEEGLLLLGFNASMLDPGSGNKNGTMPHSLMAKYCDGIDSVELIASASPLHPRNSFAISWCP